MQSRRQYKVSKHPWITPDILTAIKYKNKLYSKYLKSKSPDLYYEYKKCRNKVSHVKAKGKQKHFENLFKDARDTADTWKYINQLLKKTKSKTTLPHTIETDGKLITSPQNICNEINKHFVKIGEKLAANSNNSSIHQSNQHFTFLGKRIVSSIVLQPTDVYEIIEIISSLKDHKSPGYIDISVHIIKESKFLISDYLANSFNESLETGSYPEVLQIATVIPVHKGRSTLDLGNYRSISILSPIKNVFETILHKRLTKFWEKLNLFTEFQFDFRTKHSTNHAITCVYKTILKELDNQKSVYRIFLEFAKAFDCVNHQILLDKLDHYGIRSNANKLLKSYLTNQFQCTVNNDNQTSSTFYRLKLECRKVACSSHFYSWLTLMTLQILAKPQLCYMLMTRCCFVRTTILKSKKEMRK